MSARTSSRAKWTLGAALVLSSAPARASGSDEVKHWRSGQPAPFGYHVEREHTLGKAGGWLLAAGYGISSFYGLVFLTECYVPGPHGGRDDSCQPSAEDRAARYLFVPIAGPFLTFTSPAVRSDGGGVFWFSLFGAAQVAGAGMLAYDLAVPHYGLERGEVPHMASDRPRWLIAPAYVGRGPGLALLGQF